MNPKDTVSEISQTQKDKDCMICVIHGIGTNYLYRETVEQQLLGMEWGSKGKMRRWGDGGQRARVILTEDK